MPNDAVETIKARLNIVDVIGSYVQLQKAGKNYKARSPFTNERTPSFFVSPEDGLYYCFSSGKGGDMFTFVQEMEGVEFVDALKILADKAGVELKREDPKKRDEREKILAALEESTRFYEAQLRVHQPVIEYLKKRGVTGVSAKNFRIGYAPESWSGVYDHLIAKGYAPNIMEKAGLVVKKDDGGYYDRFRGRVMFPIANASGSIVAFSGRVFHASGASEEKTAKYVNSPETVVYNKSEILYGFDKAKRAIRDTGECILVEGQMDLVMSHQAGLEHTVAVSGTALGPVHLQQVHKLAEDLIFAFDADDAGVSAAGRGINLSLTMGFDVKVVSVPSGKDPADSILENPEDWKKSVAEAKHVIDFYLDRIQKTSISDKQMRRAVEELVLPYIARLKKSIDQGHYVSTVSSMLNISEEPLWNEVQKLQRAIHTGQDSQEKRGEKKENDVHISRKEMLLQELGAIVAWQESAEERVIDCAAFVKEIEDATEEQVALQTDEMTTAARRAHLVFTLGEKEKDDVLVYINDVMREYKKELLRERIAHLKRQLHTQTSEEEEKKILEEISMISKKITSLETS